MSDRLLLSIFFIDTQEIPNQILDQNFAVDCFVKRFIHQQKDDNFYVEKVISFRRILFLVVFNDRKEKMGCRYFPIFLRNLKFDYFTTNVIALSIYLL